MRSEQRGRAALRKSVHIFVGKKPKGLSAKKYFDIDDDLPPSPSSLLRDIGVNWLNDAAVAYGCYVIFRKDRRPARQLIRDALSDLGGRVFGRRAIRWTSLLGGRSYRIVVFVQSDAAIRHRSKSTFKLVALAKNMKLFDADELATGSYCLSNFG